MSEPDSAPEIQTYMGSDPVNGSTQALDTDREGGLTPFTERLKAIAEIILCSSVPTQLALGALLGFAGMEPLDVEGRLSLPFVLALSIGDTLLLIALMVMLTRAHGDSVSGLWLGRRRPLREIGYGLLLIPVVFTMVVLLLNGLRLVAPWLHNVPTNPLEELASTPGQAALFAVVAIFAGGVREELQRAFLLRRFERHLGGALVGVIVLSVGFGLGHIVQGWDAVITTGVLGAFWAAVYLRRRSSIAPLISHAGFNSLEVLRVATFGVS
jgi:membrane protease YdiL (CAAX protease family)